MTASMAWVDLLKNSQKTCLIQDGRRKLHFTLQDGRELAEEYDLRTNELVVRKWRKKTTLGGAGGWDFEVGEQLAPRNLEAAGLMESNTNPIFVRKDTTTAFKWRVRNLPYPVETYIISCDQDQNIIIRTSNKNAFRTLLDMAVCKVCKASHHGRYPEKHEAGLYFHEHI